MPKTLSITVPDLLFDKVVAGLCFKGNYAQTGDLALGNAGKVEFAKKVIGDFIVECLNQNSTATFQKTISDQQQIQRQLIEKEVNDSKQAILVAVN